MPNSAEKKSQIGLDIFEGLRDPIDLISIKQHGSSFPAKYIGNESVILIITKFSDLFNKEEIKSELLAKSFCSFFKSLLVEILSNGIYVNYFMFIIAKKISPKYNIQILNLQKLKFANLKNH